jgi:ATP-dependent helicase/nuclease subunit B
MKGTFTVPAGTGLLDALADGMLAWAEDAPGGPDPLRLSEATILLPTRRACLALRDIFLRRGRGRPMLLPAIRPLGAVDGEDLGLAGGPEMLDLPPPVTAVRRRMLLARLVMARGETATGPDQALRLAAALERLIDEARRARIDFDGLAGIVPDDLAEHWQQTLAFLAIVTRHWPDILTAEGALDPEDHRQRLMAAQIAAWVRQPPAGPVIAAGFAETWPALADMLAAIAALPQGVILLPTIDRGMDDATWGALDATHPETPLAMLLERLGLDRHAVPDWPCVRPDTDAPDRTVLLRETLRPAATTEAWATLPKLAPACLGGLRRIDCDTPRAEAEAIALLLREVLETPGRTAALVTPDRSLAARVAAALARWDVAVDDSAGRPLGDTPVGSLLRLAGDSAYRAASPLSLLALLKHPLVALGQEPGACRAFARLLERLALRGPPPPPGLDGIRLRLEQAIRACTDEDGEALTAWFDRLEAALGPFVTLVGTGAAAVDTLLAAHVEAAERLAATATLPGAARLWRGDDGEAARERLDELAAAAGDFPPMAGRDWPGFFEIAIEDVVVRPRYGSHPRLSILGPIEARHLRFDRVILSGLNEGTWPAPPAADPWMSRPMRAAFGLPPAEARIGMEARDFVTALAAPEVVLTRATRAEGTPTVPSRWLLRLDTVLKAAGLSLPADDRWPALAEALDQPERVRPVGPPAPRPPVAVRPRQVSVSDVETWMADPYALYARRILRLAVLDPIEAAAGAAERGQALHAALAAFVRAWPDRLPPDAYMQLIACGRTAFADLPPSPEIEAFWWPRFERVAAWFVAAEAERRTAAAPLAVEARGRIEVPAPAGPVTLSARADRIDRLADGSVAIVDYKTGTVPTAKQIAAGHHPQLPLEAAIARAGGFDGVPPAEVGELAHWRLSGGAEPGEIVLVKGDVAVMADAALAGFRALVARFDDPATPYLSEPREAPRYSDYRLLARVKEWSSGGDA